MQHIDIRKKRPQRWPWLVGVIALVGIGWGVTTLLRADDEPAEEVAGPTVQDTHPPAAIPDRPYEARGATAASSLAALAPLGEEDVGEAVRVEGEVVATGNDAFWILAGNEVLRVDSRRMVRKGDTLVVAGSLATADPDKTERIRSVLDRHPLARSWTVVPSLKLVEEGADSAEERGDSTSRG